MISLIQHENTSYSERTKLNAKLSDFTIAFGVDFTTNGEILTKKVAGKDKYFAWNIKNDPLEEWTRFWNVIYEKDFGIVNIAGNGIYTLDKYNIIQDYINNLIYTVLTKLSNSYTFKLKSGGQTGADMAAVIAGYKLGIETEVLFPKGFKRRNKEGKDYNSTSQQIFNEIYEKSEKLQLIKFRNSLGF